MLYGVEPSLFGTPILPSGSTLQFQFDRDNLWFLVEYFLSAGESFF